MTPLNFVLIAAALVFAALCVGFRIKGKAFEGFLCKMNASLCFISVAVVGYLSNPGNVYYFCFVCLALTFGFFGDSLLGLKEIAPKFKSKLIPLGTLYFLAGHTLYLSAFIKVGGFSFPPLAVGVGGGIFAAAAIRVLKMKVDKKLAAIMIFYYATLVYKISASAALAAKTGEAAFITALVGSVLFLISDSVLSILYFTPVKRKNVLVGVELSTYYPAQLLLAISAALL